MSGAQTVLVLTQSSDVTADYVVEELYRRGVPVFRCDPGDFPRRLSLAAELDGGWKGSLRLPERDVRLENVGCVWYRRPSGFDFSDKLNPEERRWAQTEARRGVGGVLATLPRWLNHPSDMARAEYKPLQLQSARAVGLTVPPTLITNDPDAARSFAKQHDQIVYKPLSATTLSEDGVHKLLYANRLQAEEITDSVSVSIHMFQAWVQKAHEVRLTVVDDALFAARIDAGSPASYTDWRSDYDSLHYSIVDVPETVRRRVLGLLEMLMLRFAALDFVVTPEGDWVFLESNPNGQWAWLQDETGLPIASAIADALAKGTSP